VLFGTLSILTATFRSRNSRSWWRAKAPFLNGPSDGSRARGQSCADPQEALLQHPPEITRFSLKTPCKVRDPHLLKNPSGSKSLFQRRNVPGTPRCREQRVILFANSDHSRRWNGRSSCRQGKRQYNQPGEQHARYKRKHRLLRVRMEVAASLCSPGHQVPHGSRLRSKHNHVPKGVHALPPLDLKHHPAKKPDHNGLFGTKYTQNPSPTPQEKSET